jgi:hypothetical protein
MELSVFDVQGRKVETKQLNLSEGQQVIKIASSNYEKGVYIIQFNQADRVTTRRLIVK